MHGVYPDIATDLNEMARLDQEMRLAAMRDPRHWDSSIDEKNTARLKEIIHQIGWPTIPKVGRDASQAAWLLAQHADRDLSFQEVCYSLMAPYGEDEVNPQNIAYIQDRIRIHQGKLQRYGTQCRNMDGKTIPHPIEDPENVDRRRLAIGLSTLAEYLKLWD